MDTSHGGKQDAENRLNKLYLAIISRYKEYMEEKESLSVAELPMLVTPNSEKVTMKSEEIKSGFLNYNYDNDFYNASIAAFRFVDSDVEDVVLPLQFWLTPDETMTFMMGDAMDKGMLLCSMLVRLGNPSAKVLVVLDDNSRRVLVHYEFKGAVHVFEDSDEPRKFASRKAMLDWLGIKEESVAYEFNNQMYADIY